MKEKILQYIKKETVLCAAVVLALVSCFLVPPDGKYLGYVHWNTVILLFCLMAVMEGLKQLGLFRFIGKEMLTRVKKEKSLVLCLVFLCFFSSMLITNDVALITFVPFGILIMRMANLEPFVLFTVTLMTIAANLGSMLTPTGNPHNLYLYGISGMRLNDFLLLMLPFTVVAGALLLLVIFIVFRNRKIIIREKPEKEKLDIKRVIYYLALFVLCLLVVAKVLNIAALLVIIVAAVLIENRRLLKSVDYSLLITFVAFFIFTGNMGRFPAFHTMIAGLMKGHERITSVMISQVISNVPASLLLAGFSNKYSQLMVGTNLGGLGTLIASMASLISYKQIVQVYPNRKGRYLLIFSVWNVVFLIVMYALSMVIM